ncbi:MAG: LemA family protein [Lachnospiraceae bacterium]|nr:LemA family protein [Lachnospiraceae bacterium]
MGYIIGAIIAFIIMWIISVQRKLSILDENVNNAMSQIGVQLASRFEALMALLDLIKHYVGYESLDLVESTRAKRRMITAKSGSSDVMEQERVIYDALERIAMMAEQYPELQKDRDYAKYRNAVDCYEKMLHTSWLIYNDSVTKFNRMIRVLPICLIAGLLGFRQRDYLELGVNYL